MYARGVVIQGEKHIDEKPLVLLLGFEPMTNSFVGVGNDKTHMYTFPFHK